MALFDASRPVVATAGIGARLQKLVSRISGAVIEWNEQRTTRAQLAKLSDHQLADLGLTRGDIETLYRR
jgi:uncharacterized protein YjiS (DUF1127 family)